MTISLNLISGVLKINGRRQNRQRKVNSFVVVLTNKIATKSVQYYGYDRSCFTNDFIL